MAISFLQGTGIQSVGSVASQAKAFNANVVAGSLLVVGGITSLADMPLNAVTDTRNNLWTRRGQLQRGAGERAAIFSAISKDAGACTVTLDCTGNDFQSIAIAEFGGSFGLDLVNFGFTGLTGSSTTPATGNLVPTKPCVIVGVLGDGGSGTVTITPAGGWTEIFENENTTNMPISMVYQLVNVPGSPFNPSWTLGASAGWTCGAVAFQESTPAITWRKLVTGLQHDSMAPTQRRI